MPKTVNEEFRTIYRPPYTVDASASAKMLNKYYDARKDGEIVDVVTLTEPYNIIGSHAFDFCHVKELTIPDTVTQLNRFAFANCKTLKKITLGKGIEKCGDDLVFRSGVQEIVWTRPIGVSVDSGFCSMLYGTIREESLLFCNPYLISLKSAQLFLKTGEPKKTFLLIYNGKSVRLPKYISNYVNMFAVVDMAHNVLISKTDCQDSTYRLILDAMSDFQNKASVALELYILEGSLDAKKYLQKESIKISETIAERGDDVALSKFISLGLMDEEALKKTMQIAMENKLQVSTAYLLDEMRKHGLAVLDSLNL